MENFVIENNVLVDYKGKKSHVVIPDGVTSIGKYAFYYNTNLKSVDIPSSVISIGEKAFADCKHLTNIKIPDSVTNIGTAAFFWCTGLKSIEIPSSVKIISMYAFSWCTGLTDIKISNSISRIDFWAFDPKEVKPQYNPNGSLRAFKAFNADWTCRDFKYAVGQSYHQDGKIKCCKHGFHACPTPLSVFNYYGGKLKELHFAEVELSGKMDIEFDKVAASDIKIVRELSISELAEIYNNMEKE